jgi:hypothetical protein
METNKVIARWESTRGKHWVELHHDGVAATYKANDCGGCWGEISPEYAIAKMALMVATGYFLPDAAKTPMRRSR